MSTAIAVEGVFKRYRAGVEGCGGHVDALCGVDLQIASGELVGVVGPAASGKTTLLLCAAGLLRPDSGQVVWFGRRRAAHAPPPGLAFAPEYAVHYTFLTVRESLEYYATLQDIPGARDRIDAALSSAALCVQARRRVSGLDHALRRRLGIARALLGQPRVLILDSPLAGLDRTARAETKEMLRELHETGLTIILSARDAWEVEDLAPRVVALVAGRVRAELTWRKEVDADRRSAIIQPFGGGGLVAEHLS